MTYKQKETEIRKSIELAALLLNPLKKDISNNFSMDIKLAIKILNRALDFHNELRLSSNLNNN